MIVAMPKTLCRVDGHAPMRFLMLFKWASVGDEVRSRWMKRKSAVAEIIWQRICGNDAGAVHRCSSNSSSGLRFAIAVAQTTRRLLRTGLTPPKGTHSKLERVCEALAPVGALFF
ncbi:MAG: hypothetical protein DME98_04300 [Verrucomicrobia bacterium]|nr:MAG: hypothetical protein DME98_04300 [Verrucomicrobiota bacterium]